MPSQCLTKRLGRALDEVPLRDYLRVMNEQTKITGRDSKSCAGELKDGSWARFEVGQIVDVLVHMDCDDGGTLTGCRTAKIERIAVGQEYGMVSGSTTALVQLTLQINSYNEGERKCLIAARHLKPSARKNG